MAEPMIRIQGLYKIFGAAADAVLPGVRDGMGKQELLDTHGCVLGLRDIDLAVPERCIQVVMGLSGSGKSTLIRHINRLIAPTAGAVIVAGTDVARMDRTALQDFRRHRASMVFQRFALMPHRTVRANVAYGLTVQGLAGRRGRPAGRPLARAGRPRGTSPTATPGSSRAACSSAWASAGRWPPTPTSC